MSTNAATLVTPPKAPHVERPTWTLEQARAFLDAVKDYRLAALFRVAVGTGLRQAEVLGMRWQDVDLDAGVLHVRHTLARLRESHEYRLVEPKTNKSRRDLPLEAPLVSVLRQHRARQNEERLRAGGAWQDNGLVFTNETGGPINGPWLTHRFERLAEQAGLPVVPFHSLRHFFATSLVAGGVAVPDAMALLGHSNVSTTLGIYSHGAKDTQRAAVNMVDALLSAEG